MADLPGRGAALGAGAVLLLAGAGWAAHSTDLLRTHRPRATTPAIVLSSAPVERTDVRQQQTVTGVLTYAGSYSVIAPGGGAGSQGGGAAGSPDEITWLPTVGATVRRGQRVYEVNGVPVPLLFGRRPAWRDLYLGVADGSDVAQLKRNLAALGHGTGLVMNDTFDLATAQAVAAWQRAEGLPVTGTVPLGQVAYLPGALLVGQQVAAVGGPVPSGTPILTGASTVPSVQVLLDPSVLPNLQRGSQVTVTLPDGSTDPGRVTQVSKVAATQPGNQQSQQSPDQQQALVPVTVTLGRSPHRFLDQAPVQVAITTGEHRNVLAVPITALLAEPGGRFAVVVVSGTDGSARRTVDVRTGLFDQGAGDVEVSGPGLAAGQAVEVPSQ
jgi:peptidoglycan hydrolase-like protein with peptidoglycan-binding domain